MEPRFKVHVLRRLYNSDDRHPLSNKYVKLLCNHGWLFFPQSTRVDIHSIISKSSILDAYGKIYGKHADLNTKQLNLRFSSPSSYTRRYVNLYCSSLLKPFLQVDWCLITWAIAILNTEFPIIIITVGQDDTVVHQFAGPWTRKTPSKDGSLGNARCPRLTNSASLNI